MKTNFLILQWAENTGAEISELIGLYTSQGLKNILPNLIIGFNRDDGLIAVENKLSNVEIEKN